MIFVTVGTQVQPFTRLLDTLEDCIARGIISQPVVVQNGNTPYVSQRMELVGFLDQDTLRDYMQKADFVIAHAGVGTIFDALSLEKKLVVVPRLKQYHEHVNNHQLEIIEVLVQQGYILGCEMSQLEQTLAQLDDFKPKQLKRNTERLIGLVENFIDTIE